MWIRRLDRLHDHSKKIANEAIWKRDSKSYLNAVTAITTKSVITIMTVVTTTSVERRDSVVDVIVRGRRLLLRCYTPDAKRLLLTAEGHCAVGVATSVQ